MTRLTTRAQEMLLNILEGRSYKAKWRPTTGRWMNAGQAGGSTRRLLESLEAGGLLTIRPTITLTEAGLAMAHAYKLRWERRGRPIASEAPFVPGHRAVGKTGATIIHREGHPPLELKPGFLYLKTE